MPRVTFNLPDLHDEEYPLDDYMPTILTPEKLVSIPESEPVLFVSPILPELQLTQLPPASPKAIKKELCFEDTVAHFHHLIKTGASIAAIDVFLIGCKQMKSLLVATDAVGNTCLHFASKANHATAGLLRSLLQYGAAPNQPNRRGQTPLHINVLTSTRDDPSTTLTLLHYGANPNIKENSGNTPLHLAIEQNYLHISQALIRKNGSINIADQKGVYAWQKSPRMKSFLIQSIRYAPNYIKKHKQQDCMACGDAFKRVGKRIGNCVHCGRLCCANCLNKKVMASKLPDKFFRYLKKKPIASKQKKIDACRLCRQILQERSHTPTKQSFLERLFLHKFVC